MEWWQIIVPVTALLGILGAIFNAAVIKPLCDQIKNLSDVIESMKKQMHDTEEKRQGMDMRLTRVEESTKHAHHRLDDLASEVRNV